MSYSHSRRHQRRHQRRVLGDVGDVLATVFTAADAGVQILADPSLPQITQGIMTLHQLEQVPGAPPVPGIGLNRFILPLQAYITFRQSPVVIGALAVGVLFGIPFLLGRASKG